MKDSAGLPAYRLKRREILDRPDFGVGKSKRDERGVAIRAERFAHAFRIDSPIAIRRDPHDLETSALELEERSEDRGVFDLGRNNLAPPRRRGNRAEDREIVRLGAAAGENDLPRVRADDRADLRARVRASAARAGLRDGPTRDSPPARQRSAKSTTPLRVSVERPRYDRDKSAWRFCTPSMKRLAYLTATGRKSTYRR